MITKTDKRVTNPISDDIQYIIEQTKTLWSQLKDERIFITGGTGFFGRWILETLVGADREFGLNLKITVLSRNPYAFIQQASNLLESDIIYFHVGDIRSFSFPKDDFSTIIHLASASAESWYFRESNLIRFDTIVMGTRRVLDFAKTCKTKTLLYTSSGLVYGRQPSEIYQIHETFNGVPDIEDTNAALGIGKRVAEFLCTVYSKEFDIEAKIARCFTFVGPYLQLNLHYAVGNFIRDALRGGPIIVKSDGRAIRSYMYMTDLVVWLLYILIYGKSCYPYNVGSEEQITIGELAHKVAEVYKRLTGKSVDVIIEKSPDPSKPVDRYVPSTRRAREELGLKQTVSLDEAIERTFRFYMSF